MRKPTHIYYDQMDVKKIVRDELERAKPDWIKDITEEVTKIVAEKFDKVMTVLDRFVGLYKKTDETQTLQGGQMDKLFERMGKLEQRFKHPVT